MKKLTSLPHPDEYGNYWFKSHKTETAPAIFISLLTTSLSPRYFVSLGERGIIFDQGQIKLFHDPQEALKAIQKFFNDATN